jgi:ribosomal protein L32
MDAVPKSTISRMKKRAFRNVDVKKAGSTFSKCSECTELKEFQCATARNSTEEKKWQRRFDEHMAHQFSCRKLYYSWRTESDRSPLEVLCIIHDGMDSRKTALPRLRIIMKGSSGLGQLPMTLTGMLTHGHGDGAYANFSTDFWPRDSNFTIYSLASCIRRLERPAMRNSKALFEERQLSPFFEKLM